MFEALVIIFWFLVFYLAHKIYYEYKIKMMRKKWNSIKHEQEGSNDLVFNSWYNRWLFTSLVKNLAVFRPLRPSVGQVDQVP